MQKVLESLKINLKTRGNQIQDQRVRKRVEKWLSKWIFWKRRKLLLGSTGIILSIYLNVEGKGTVDNK